tara:strand:+ start:858 stop:2624 length:1767 start_codon:yes stop_codon:yes gene_type:complete
LKTVKALMKARRSWYLYDWANQAFALSVLAIFIPNYITTLFDTATGGGKEILGFTITGSGFFAFSLSATTFLAAIISPLIGVIVDHYPIKKKILWRFTILGVIATMLIGIVPFMGFQLPLITIFFMLANIGFCGGNAVYYAFIPSLSDNNCSVDEISSKGCSYGFAGGVTLLIFHILFLNIVGNAPWALSVIFISSGLWWISWGYFLFKFTPEPKIYISKQKSKEKLFTLAIDGIKDTLKNMKNYSQLFLFLIAYFLFFDGVNTIASIAVSFGTDEFRLSQAASGLLGIVANLTAVPMTIIFGKIAEKIGSKKTLMCALSVYCIFVPIMIGLAPLELGLPNNKDELERYDVQLSWDKEKDKYNISTLYNKSLCCESSSWISSTAKGDSVFRNAIKNTLLIKNPTWSKKENITALEINDEDVTILLNNLQANNNHRFSLGINGGVHHEKSIIGNDHPTIFGDGFIDFWPTMLRDYIWSPLNLSINLQYILMGLIIGSVMGTITAQGRTMITELVPKKQISEFFGFFSFIMKAVAVVGPLIFFIISSMLDNRSALLSIVFVIFIGTFLCALVDMEKGKKEASIANKTRNK